MDTLSIFCMLVLCTHVKVMFMVIPQSGDII